MMVIVLALTGALSYSVGDFFGGSASRRAPVLDVVWWSQLLGLPVVVIGVLLVRGDGPTWPVLAWGVGAGTAGVCGLVLLYHGLAVGKMSVVSPLTSVCAAALPVGAGLAFGERPGVLAVIGAVIGIGAIGALGASGGGGDHAHVSLARMVAIGIGGGIGFGAMFILLERAGDHAGMWPLVGARVGSLVTVMAIITARRERLRFPRAAARPAMAAGVLDMGANVLYLLAVQRGTLTMVAVITSLYPGGTVVLARVVLKERITRWHLFGLVLAGAAVVLFAIG